MQGPILDVCWHDDGSKVGTGTGSPFSGNTRTRYGIIFFVQLVNEGAFTVILVLKEYFKLNRE